MKYCRIINKNWYPDPTNQQKKTPSDYMQNILFRYLHIVIKHWVIALFSWLMSVIVTLHTRSDISNCSRLNTPFVNNIRIVTLANILCNPDATWSHFRSNKKHLKYFQTLNSLIMLCHLRKYHRNQAVTLLCLAIKLSRYFLHVGWYISATSHCCNSGRFTTCVRHGKTKGTLVVPLRSSNKKNALALASVG